MRCGESCVLESCVLTNYQKQVSVQFISASRPSTEYFFRNTGTGSNGHSCHL